MAKVKLTELMKEKQLLSFEVFPPKTDKGMENLPGTIEKLCEFNPGVHLLYIWSRRRKCRT